MHNDEFLQSGHIHNQGLEHQISLSTVFLKSSVRNYTTYKLTTILSSLQTSYFNMFFSFIKIDSHDICSFASGFSLNIMSVKFTQVTACGSNFIYYCANNMPL